MTLFLLVLGVMGLVMTAMAVGVILKRPCLRGSCGGPDVLGPDGESLACATCPNRREA
jgi:uncharacterized protein